MQVERRLGGRLLDKPKQIPFQDGGHNLCLTIEDLGQGWRSKLAANYQVSLLFLLTPLEFVFKNTLLDFQVLESPYE